MKLAEILNERGEDMAELLRKAGGKTYSFKNLPPEAQKAIKARHRDILMQNDAYDKNGVLKITKGKRFGYVNIPMADLKAMLLKATNDALPASKRFKDFDALHQNYMKTHDIRKYRKQWPVLVIPESGDIIFDGTNRFHTYVEQKREFVPAWYYV